MSSGATFDVTIVGAGPVGLTLAGLLGRLGHRVCVIERFASVYPLPRAVRFDGEAMRIFQGLGIVDEIEHDIVAADHYVWYGADGEVIIDFDLTEPAPSGWSSAYSFWQPTLDRALEGAATRQDTVTVMRGWQAQAVRQAADRVELELGQGTETAGGEWRASANIDTIGSRYVIGADGANSLLRTASKIGVRDLGFAERWLVVDLRPHDMEPWTVPPVSAQFCDPRRPTVKVRNGGSYRRWEFMLLPGEKAEDFTDPAAVWRLLAGEIGPHEATLVRHAVYEFRSRLAETMRDRRILLAGDAAHVMPPFMGEGMCSGLRDANNLAWRLDLILRGLCDEPLLDAYSIERIAHNEAITALSIEMGRISCTVDHEAAARRDAALRSGDVPPPPAFPGLVDGTVHTPAGEADPVAGRLAVQGMVRAPDGRTGRLDDVVGPGFVLVTTSWDPSELSTSDLEFLDSIGTRTVALEPASGGFADLDGALTSWLDREGLAAVIARPDGYAFGGVRTRAELPLLVQGLREKLSARRPAAGS
jgi:2-polyprenyl-6-methoxyphenol hydroxylase-like FAD-dependent oxidoreductase